MLQETLGYITREHECINEENLLPVVKRWRISRINKGERGKKEKEKKKRGEDKWEDKYILDL